MDILQSYSQLYPDLPIEIIIFFSDNVPVDGKIHAKTLMDFLSYYQKKKNTPDMPQPNIVSKICDIMIEHNYLSCVSRDGFAGTQNTYIGMIRPDTLILNEELLGIQNFQLSCKIYGFPYILRAYNSYILPIIYKTKKGDTTIGTTFLTLGGIATAKHCLVGAESLAIKHIDKKILENSKILIHKNPLMDLAFIKFPTDKTHLGIYLIEEGNVLDDVLALGFPKVPGFHNFLTAEKAQISSRFTATTGQIAAEASDIWIKEKLLLITAKIKGGNSGGPIINRNGALVGIASQMPASEGDYDNLGYGTVIPSSFLTLLKEEGEDTIELNLGKTIFEDFEE